MARLIMRRLLPLALVSLAVLVAAPARSGALPARAARLQTVTISMGYIPNVQFAPFYLAQSRGYYAAAGLNVKFDYQTSSDVIKLVGSGSVAFGNAEADQVILGHAHGLPVISVFAQYQRFPVVIFALRSSGIRSFADLKGKTIGIPGLYGASYTGLLAALQAAHLTSHDVHIEAIGYAQVAAVAEHRVDAAVGFAMNEPVQLQLQGSAVTVLPIYTLVPLAGPGVVTSRSMIAQHPDLVRRFVAATYRGQKETDADPVAAFAIARKYMPSLSSRQATYQLAVLRAAVPYWTPPAGRGLGCANLAWWTATQNTLLAQHQITARTDVSALFTNRFVPGC